ncbi:DUF692 domain-containing protein [Aliagarivorans taiwanensis]|uniref:MNIO family bufferin maturase n=1 Tax=Aliagarivorans taiwanensis TaxID=561966 RepID=UPI0004069297|nr:DUF692 domain-containing protein [Aliagarivorans taiwanensis]
MQHLQFGLGIRSQIANSLTQQKHPAIDFVEAHTENYFNPHSLSSHQLSQAAQHYPVTLHGVGLSLGSAQGLDKQHLLKVKQCVERYQPALVSEHLSWSQIDGQHFNDLLPVPYTEESFKVFADNIKQFQDTLQRQILIENPSAYLQYADSKIAEADFLNQLSAETGCGLLLDINNVFVSAFNQNSEGVIDAGKRYLEQIDSHRVKQLHMAGHTEKQIGDACILIDTHNQLVRDEVWELYRHYLSLSQAPMMVLLEWDSDFPEFEVLEQQLSLLRTHADSAKDARELSHA